MIFQRVGPVLVKKQLTPWGIVPKGLLGTDITERGEKVPENRPDCDEFLADLRCHLNVSPN